MDFPKKKLCNIINMNKSKLFSIVVFIVYVNNCFGDYIYENEACQFKQQCIEDAVILATNQSARKYQPYCEGGSTSFSCKSQCGSLNGCCFPYIVNYSVASDRTLQSCMPAYSRNIYVLPEDKRYTMSFYTVDKDPPAGCVKEYNGSGCSSIVAEWGNYYPVTSKTTGTIYKNVECARCHGDYNVQYWNGFKRCTQNGTSASVVALNWKSRNNFTFADNCYTVYRPSSYNTLEARCYQNLIESCRINFDIPSDIHLSKSHVETLCRSDYFSPRQYDNYNITYANIFCLLCNVDLNWTSITKVHQDRRACKTTDEEHRVLLSLTNILETNYVNETESTDSCKSVGTTKRACLTTANCRRWYCSTGTMCLKGYCESSQNAVVNGQYILNVTLTYYGATLLKLSYMYGIEIKGQLESRLKGPWGEKWDIKTLSVRYSLHNLTTTVVVDKIYITMFYKPFLLVYIQDIVLEVDYILQSTWSFIAPSCNIQFDMKSSFGHGIELTNEAWTRIKNESLIPDDIDETQADTNPRKSLISTRYNTSNNTTTTLSKLMFCEQVKLLPHEYVLIKQYSIVYLKQTGRFLGDSEFMTDDSDPYLGIKVCLKDAGFYILLEGNANIRLISFTTASGFSHTQRFSNVLLYTILLIVLRILYNNN